MKSPEPSADIPKLKGSGKAGVRLKQQRPLLPVGPKEQEEIEAQGVADVGGEGQLFPSPLEVELEIPAPARHLPGIFRDCAEHTHGFSD